MNLTLTSNFDVLRSSNIGCKSPEFVHEFDLHAKLAFLKIRNEIVWLGTFEFLPELPKMLSKDA